MAVNERHYCSYIYFKLHVRVGPNEYPQSVLEQNEARDTWPQRSPEYTDMG